MRTVQDIINSKPTPFNIIGPKALVIDALSMLNSVNLSYLIVMDGDDYKGIFSERDYTRNVILKGRTSSTSTVEEIMTKDFPVVHMTETVEHCMHTMNSHKTRYLLAYDGKKFVGVITIHDLLRQVIASKEDVFDHRLAAKLIEHESEGKIY